MNRYAQDKPSSQNRRGATMWLFLIMLPTLIIVCLMCINVAYMNLTRTELRIATDSAARSAGRMLAISGSQEQAMIFGRDAASRNTIGSQPLMLDDSDFEFGRSQRTSLGSRYMFSPLQAGQFPSAVRLNGRRTSDSPSGPVNLFAPRLLSIGSFEPTHRAISTQLELDVALVVDRSGSMAYADDEVAGLAFPPPSAPPGWNFGQPAPPASRWLNVVDAVQAFLDEMTATPLLEQVGLATYSPTASLDVPMTSNYQEIMNSLDTRTQSFQYGATNIGGGLMEGINLFSTQQARPWATKVIVLLTDGVHNTGTEPISLTDEAREAGITIFSVTFSDEAEQIRMQRVAQQTGGTHIHAQTGADLVQAFRDIAHRLPTLLTQ